MTINSSATKFFGAGLRADASLRSVRFGMNGAVHELVLSPLTPAAVLALPAYTARRALLSSDWSTRALDVMETSIQSAPVVSVVPTFRGDVALVSSDMLGSPVAYDICAPLASIGDGTSIVHDAAFWRNVFRGANTVAKRHKAIRDFFGATNPHTASVELWSQFTGLNLVELTTPAEIQRAAAWIGRGMGIVCLRETARAGLIWGGCTPIGLPGLVVPSNLGTKRLLAFRTSIGCGGMTFAGNFSDDVVGTFADSRLTAITITHPGGPSMASVIAGFSADAFYLQRFSYTGSTAAYGYPSTTATYDENDAPTSYAMPANTGGSTDLATVESAFGLTSQGTTFATLVTDEVRLSKHIDLTMVGRPPGMDRMVMPLNTLIADAATQVLSGYCPKITFGIESTALAQMMQMYLDDANASQANKSNMQAALTRMLDNPDAFLAGVWYNGPRGYTADSIESTVMFAEYQSAIASAGEGTPFYDIAATDGTKLSTLRNNANNSTANEVMLMTRGMNGGDPVSPTDYQRAIRNPAGFALTVTKVTPVGGAAVYYTADLFDSVNATTSALSKTSQVAILVASGVQAVYTNCTAGELLSAYTLTADDQRVMSIVGSRPGIFSLNLAELFPSGYPDLDTLTADARIRALFMAYGVKMTGLLALVRASIAYTRAVP